MTLILKYRFRARKIFKRFLVSIIFIRKVFVGKSEVVADQGNGKLLPITNGFWHQNFELPGITPRIFLRHIINYINY